MELLRIFLNFFFLNYYFYQFRCIFSFTNFQLFPPGSGFAALGKAHCFFASFLPV